MSIKDDINIEEKEQKDSINTEKVDSKDTKFDTSTNKKSGLKSSKQKSNKEELIKNLTEEEIKELLISKETLKEALDETRKLLEEKDVLIREYEDLLKRKQAEFENYRKRINREMEENKKYANVEIILDIINVLDDFERAIDSAKSSRDFDALLEGIIMIERQLRGVLEKKYGVKRIEAVGKEFDPSKHDAIMMEESEEVKEDTVVEDFQKGYIMHDRIIRPSKVKVAKPVSSSTEKYDFNDFKEFKNELKKNGTNDTSSNDNIEKNDENISEKGE